MLNSRANRRLAATIATLLPSNQQLSIHSTSSSSEASLLSSSSSSSLPLFPSPTASSSSGLKSHIVGIVGAGKVGSACVSSLIQSKVVGHILVADVNEQLCRGEVMDLQDEAFITGTIIEQVKFSDLRSADIIIITAGAAQKPGETRLNLIDRNAKILQSILKQIFPLNPSTIIIMVTNPVDILTEIARRLCSPFIPANQVIGSGTYLDSQRLRVSLSKKTGVSVKSIHAFIIGEHGDAQVFARSSAMIGGERLSDWSQLTAASLTDSELEARTKAYEIIRLKGSTSHGIGACVAALCRAIVFDEKKVLPISVYHPGYHLYMGWPTVIGSKGAERIINISLNHYETEKIKDTVASLKKVLDGVKIENIE